MKEKLEKKTFTSNEKLKANRASETKNKQRQRIGREKDKARRITQKLQVMSWRESIAPVSSIILNTVDPR